MEEILHNKLIGIQSYDKKIIVQGTKIETSIKISQSLPFKGMITKYYNKGKYEYQSKQRAKCLKPYQYIRMIRGFRNE